MMQPRYPTATVQQPQQQSTAVAAGYQFYTPLYSPYPSVAVPPPPATWLQPAAATATPGTVAPGIVLPQQLQQLQPAVCFNVCYSLDVLRNQLSNQNQNQNQLYLYL